MSRVCRAFDEFCPWFQFNFCALFFLCDIAKHWITVNVIGAVVLVILVVFVVFVVIGAVAVVVSGVRPSVAPFLTFFASPLRLYDHSLHSSLRRCQFSCHFFGHRPRS